MDGGGQSILRFASIERDVYAPWVVTWKLKGTTGDGSYTAAITDGDIGTYMYSGDPSGERDTGPAFSIDLSPLPELCRFKSVYWDAWIRLKNMKDLDTASLTLQFWIGYAKKKQQYQGTPRCALATDTLTFRQLVGLGVNTSGFTHIELRELSGWDIWDTDPVTYVVSDGSLMDAEVWRKGGATLASLRVEAVDGDNQVQAAELRARYRCDAP